MKIIIAAPAYTDESGGIMCLHHLSDVLATKGIDAHIASETTFEGNRAKLIPWIFGTDAPGLIDTSIPVVYPEVTFGNPLNSSRCIRWLLNAPGIIDGPTEFPEEDLLFAWGDRCHPKPPRKVDGYLRIFEPRLDLFQDEGHNRKGWLTLFHKGKPYRYHIPGARNIDQDKVRGLEHMADIFKRAKVLISYDPNTFTSVHAALSGCLSIVAPIKGISAKQQRQESWYHKYGIAYGYADIPRAIRTLPKLRPFLEEQKRESHKTVDAFIERVKDWV